VAVQLGHALALHPDRLAGLGAGRHLDALALALDRRHLDLAAEAAVVIGIGTRQWMFGPSRRKIRCGATETKM
jgi:hypothetical protein